MQECLIVFFYASWDLITNIVNAICFSTWFSRIKIVMSVLVHINFLIIANTLQLLELCVVHVPMNWISLLAEWLLIHLFNEGKFKGTGDCRLKVNLKRTCDLSLTVLQKTCFVYKCAWIFFVCDTDFFFILLVVHNLLYQNT